MLTTRTAPRLIYTRRLDPDYYAPVHIQDEAHLRRFGCFDLGACGRFFAGPFGSELPGSLYRPAGVPLLRVGNVGSLDLIETNLVFLDEQTHQKLSASEVIPGDLLIVKASVGEKVCRFPSRFARGNITQHIIGVRPNGSADMDFVAAVLFSDVGRRQLARRSLGSIIQYLGVVDARSVLIPSLDAFAQRYIGDKVRQAEMLRERARKLDEVTSAVFAPLTLGLRPPAKAWRVPARAAEAYRLNPTHFDPVVLEAIETAQLQTRLVALADLVPDGDIAGGATPLGAQYASEGIFFARVQNVKPLRLDRSDAAYISPTQDGELARSRCREGDVILSITGYPGTASVVMDEDLPLNINQHSVRFTVDRSFGAGFVAAAINSQFGQLQVTRFAVGGTRDALDYASVRSLFIPELTVDSRVATNKRVELANRSLRAAQRLTVCAKQLVDELIEGKIREHDLIAAQKAMESGDRGADRALLQAMRNGGGDGAPALFPEVNALYALLDDVDQGGGNN